jgi:hypothetical protein
MVRQKLPFRPSGWQASRARFQRVARGPGLQAIETVVKTTLGEELAVRPAFANGTVVQH